MGIGALLSRLAPATRPAASNDKGTHRMARRRGNPNWGKTDQQGPVVIVPSSFDQIVKELGLTPEQCFSSARLREWARLNRASKYVPETLLKEWGLEEDSPA